MASVFEKALTMDWVETVMFPYNIVETQGEALMQRCREQNGRLYLYEADGGRRAGGCKAGAAVHRTE